MYLEPIVIYLRPIVIYPAAIVIYISGGVGRRAENSVVVWVIVQKIVTRPFPSRGPSPS